jgi:hypothetical protein
VLALADFEKLAFNFCHCCCNGFFFFDMHSKVFLAKSDELQVPMLTWTSRKGSLF